jgi:hypothetical protein
MEICPQGDLSIASQGRPDDLRRGPQTMGLGLHRFSSTERLLCNCVEQKGSEIEFGAPVD